MSGFYGGFLAGLFLGPLLAVTLVAIVALSLGIWKGGE